MGNKATSWGIALSLALGVTAIAATSALPSFFGASAQADGDAAALVQWSSSTPANGAIITDLSGFSHITVTYSKYESVSINRQTTEEHPAATSTLYYRADSISEWNAIQSFTCNDPTVFKYDSGDESKVHIWLPSAVTEVGEYKLSVAAGTFSMVQKVTGTDESGNTTTTYETVWNDAQDLAFSLEKPGISPVYTPAAGGVGSLHVFNLTIPGATSIEWTEDGTDEAYAKQDSIRLVHYNKTPYGTVEETNDSTGVTTTKKLYYPGYVQEKFNLVWKFEGANVTIQAEKKIVQPSQNAIKDEYYQIVIPKGMLSYTMDGEKVVYNKDITIGTYKIEAFGTNCFEAVLPAGYNPGDSFKEVTLTFPNEEITYKLANASATAYLSSLNGDAFDNNGDFAQYSIAAVADQKNTFKLTMKACTDVSKIMNNPAMWETGEVRFMFGSNVFSAEVPGASTVKNAKMWSPSYYVKGHALYPKQITPVPGSVLDKVSGISQLKLVMNKKWVAIAGKNVQVYVNDKLAREFAVDGNYASATEGIAASTLTYNFPPMNESGVYKFVFPAGCFRQTTNAQYANDEFTIEYTVPDALECVVSPANGATIYPEGVAAVTDVPTNPIPKITLTFPEAAAIAIKDPTALLQMAYNVVKPTSNNQYLYKPSVEGNSIVLTYEAAGSSAWKTAKAGTNPYYLSIPGGAFEITTKDGKKVENSSQMLSYCIALCPEFDCSIANKEITALDLVNGFTLTCPEPWVFMSCSNTSGNAAKIGKNPGNDLLSNVYTWNGYLACEIDSNDNRKATFKFVTSDYNPEKLGASYVKSPYSLPSGNYFVNMQNMSTQASSTIAYGRPCDWWFIPGKTTAYKDSVTASAAISKTDKEKGVVPYMVADTLVWERVKFNNTYYNFTLKGLETAENVAIDGPTVYEQIPDTIAISAPEGVSFFAGEEETWKAYKLNTSGSYTAVNNSKYQPLAVKAIAKDGKVYLIPDWASASPKVTPGKYRIGTTTGTGSENVPTGSLKVGDNKTNFLFNIGFEVTGPISDPTVSVLPVPGKLKVAENPGGLNVITLNYQLSFPIELNANCEDNIQIYKKGEGLIATLDKGAVMFNPGENQVMIALEEAIDEDGTYTLIIPRGYFNYGVLKTGSVEYDYTWEVEGLEPAVISSTSPADGALVDGFEGINVNFSSPVEIQSIETIGEVYVSYGNPLDPMYQPSILPLHAYLNADKASIQLTVDEETEEALIAAGNWPLKVSGTYSVYAAKDAIKLTTADGVYGTPEIAISYDVIKNTAYSVVPKATDYITELKEFTVSFTGMTQVAAVGETIPCTVTGPEGAIAATAALNGSKVVVTLAETQTAKGTYKLYIPAKALSLAAAANLIPSYNSEVSASVAIGEAPKITNIYPTDGSVIEFFTNVNIDYDYGISRNRSCTDECWVKVNGEVKYSFTNNASAIQYTPEGNDKQVIFNFTSGQTVKQDMTPGKYEVHIPAGFLLIGGKATNEEINLTYTIAKAPNMIMTPSNGTTVKEVGKFVFRFPDAEKIEVDLDATDPVGLDMVGLDISCKSAGAESMSLFNSEIDYENKVVTLWFTTHLESGVSDTYIPQSVPGQYNFFVPKGVFKVWENGALCAQSQKVYQFFIPEFPAPVITPAPGVISTNGLAGDITMTLEDGLVFGWLKHTQGFGLFKADDAGNKILGERVNLWAYDAYRAENGGLIGRKYNNEPSSVILTNQNPNLVLEPGNYVFQLASLSFGIGVDPYSIDADSADPDCTYKIVVEPYMYGYTVVDADLPAIKPEITPAEGETTAVALQNIKVAYPGFEGVMVNNYDCYLYDGDNTIDLIPSAVGNVVSFAAPSELELGNYTLSVAAGTISLIYQGIVMPAPAIKAQFVVTSKGSGVAELFGEGELLDVYTVNGVCVLRGASAADVNALEEGFYVVNGKKLYLKK